MTLTAQHLEPHIGETVIVGLDDGTEVALTLDKVSPSGAGSDDGNGGVQHTAFALDLSGPLEPLIQSLTYPVLLPGQDTRHLFINAHGQDENGTYYAIFVT